ncbi:MAG TPA: hypothetical protein VNS22_18270 [Geminicoccus sp.]|nr:hypothetical protein [Geminicoccus sp.]HWL70306.1 hypothetical protein [Geminicoccus sp.]
MFAETERLTDQGVPELTTMIDLGAVMARLRGGDFQIRDVSLT